MSKINAAISAVISDMLFEYAPTDDKLLDIKAHYFNMGDPFLRWCAEISATSFIEDRSLFCIGMNLLRFLQSLNRVLSKVYASHRFIFEQGKNIQNNTKKEIKEHIHHHIITDYSYSLRDFISMLRIAVDQLIILIVIKSGIKGKCDSIGRLLKRINKDTKFLNSRLCDDKEFLILLNAAANYLKHHPYQFEEPYNAGRHDLPIIYVIVRKKDKEAYSGCIEILNNECIIVKEDLIVFPVSCDLLVSGFNDFSIKIITSF